MRRHDLDWLRVLVFALLIFYHVGMFFVPWGWHIKNKELSEALIWPMAFLNRWRLPILFVISGMGTWFALGKRTGRQFAGERLKRLYIPLAIGMLLVVPPQVYLERLVNGEFTGSYLDFWPLKAFIGIYPEGNFSWHHLWFLPYLLTYSLLLTPLWVYMRKHPDNRLARAVKNWLKRPLGIFLFIIPLYLCEAFLEPFFEVTHNLVWDWFNFTSSGFLFFMGFLLMNVREAFWARVMQSRYLYLMIGIVAFSLQMVFWTLIEDSIIVHFTEAWVAVINLWAWVLTLFGFAATYLNRPSKTLTYANEAVYPFYILHQTVTIILGFFLMDLLWPIWLKASLMVLGTFGISWLIYEVGIRRWRWVRPLFGLKNGKKGIEATVGIEKQEGQIEKA